MNSNPALADLSTREAITDLRRHMQTCLDQLDAFRISGPDIHLDMALARFDMLFPFASDKTVSGVEQDERETS